MLIAAPLLVGTRLMFPLTRLAYALIAVHGSRGQGPDQFLGTQSDPRDTQWDMFMALVGTTSALALLSRLHDRQIARLLIHPV